jgi:hypothetical protein
MIEGIDSKSQMKEREGGRKKIIVIVVVVIVLIAIIATVVFAFLMGKGDTNKKETITPENVEERVDEIFNRDMGSIPQYYTATQNSVWAFPDGNSAGSAYVENVQDNETPVYFDLIVDDTGEVVYSSPILELGARLDSFRLDKYLDKGEYNCTVVYHLVDQDQNTLTTVNVGVTVIVEN